MRLPVGRLYAPAAPRPQTQGRGGPLQFPPPPSERSAPLTAGGSSAPLLPDLYAFHCLHPATPGSAPPFSPFGVGVTPPQALLHAAGRSVAPPHVAFDAGL